jgi:hypothetical protein
MSEMYVVSVFSARIEGMASREKYFLRVRKIKTGNSEWALVIHTFRLSFCEEKPKKSACFYEITD